MRRWAGLVILTACVAASSGYGQTRPASSSRGPRLEAVTLFIQHRVFHDFRDLQRVKLNQDFILGDTEFSGRVVQYVPDFQMDLATRKVFSLTDQPRNPAFKIVVRKGKVSQDTAWAFLNMPPHFSRKSYFAFQVLRVDFTDRAPLLADTTAATPAPPPVDHDARVPAAPAAKDTASHR